MELVEWHQSRTGRGNRQIKASGFELKGKCLQTRRPGVWSRATGTAGLYRWPCFLQPQPLARDHAGKALTDPGILTPHLVVVCTDGVGEERGDTPLSIRSQPNRG
ncbi:hypothetical protein KIL84_021436 [Mauremys mutica]|uniref:Uncharacterized protein n=1 Tax=Mauremys mutica TaxID=74926 RepID=A0A9D3X8T2_9SAUR|nr:hypothetical protein KIL84_021436 [Mauremys mutica]